MGAADVSFYSGHSRFPQRPRFRRMDSLNSRPDLFPDLQPFSHGMLDVDGLHNLYWEQCGNPQGIPVIFLHGGPGAGTSPAHRRFFDPRHYRIVLFDQRGAGRSRPLAEVRDNTTAHLIADVECLRRHLGIDRWLVFGGSWGAALALAYGIAHPAYCLGFVLRGVFLARRWELEWFLNGMSTVHPEAGRAFIAFLPEAERSDPVGAYHRRLISDNPALHRPAARAWAAYENACSRFAIAGDGTHAGNSASTALTADTGGWAPLALARIECHYFRNAMFLEEGALLAGVGRIRHLPCRIVQGRYDLVCPPASAHDLAAAWPGSRLEIVPDAGHSAMEAGTRRALVAATEELRAQLDGSPATSLSDARL